MAQSVSSRTAKLAVVIVALVALGAGAAFWWSQRSDKGNGALRLYGNVDIREVQLAFRQPGRVTHMAFDEGDAVSAGARVAALDAQPYRDALAAAQAQVQVAQAELVKLRRGLRPQEITQAREALRQAQALAAETERNFQRQSALLASGASSSAPSTPPARRATRPPRASRQPRPACRRHPKVSARKTSPRHRLALRPRRLPPRKPPRPWRTPNWWRPATALSSRACASPAAWLQARARCTA